MVNCEHCKTVELVKDEKTGALVCPQCKCTFRVVLVRFDTKCYNRIYRDEIKEIVKEQKREKKTGKSGRPRKDKEEVKDNVSNIENETSQEV